MPDTCLEDFDYLAQTLREIHPAYAEDARPLEEAAAVLKQQWLGREDIRITLGRLAALPGDGHTNLEIPCRTDTPLSSRSRPLVRRQAAHIPGLRPLAAGGSADRRLRPAPFRLSGTSQKLAIS